ncbi:MAG TPA: putative Ig domain-containing protein [Acidobacteriota bacterium]|nr:putative Ig domain-containing protein [Acidobacteriota bacterium]
MINSWKILRGRCVKSAAIFLCLLSALMTPVLAASEISPRVNVTGVPAAGDAGKPAKQEIPDPSVEYPSLQVFLHPDEAVSAGAKWRLLGSVEWWDSGFTYEDLGLGETVTVEFKAINGWAKPANKAVTIGSGLTKLDAWYKAAGGINVVLYPQGAVDAGARWRRVGTEVWRESGTTESGVETGDYTLEFKSLPGWGTPDNMPITVLPNQTITCEAYYTSQNGYLKVRIAPIEARNAGARWFVDGTATAHLSDETIALPAGPHQVYFSYVKDLARPDFKIVNILNGQTTTVLGTYQPLIVGNVRILANRIEISAFLRDANFIASGNVRLAFATKASSPVEPAGFTYPYVKIGGQVQGTFSPARIQGNGPISIEGIGLAVLGSVPILNGSFVLDGQGLKISNINLPPLLKYLGLDLKLSYLQFLTEPFGVAMGAKLILPSNYFGSGNFIEISRMSITGLDPTKDIKIQGEIKIPDFDLGGLIKLRGLHGVIDTPKSTLIVTVNQVKILLITVSGGIEIKDGRLTILSVNAKNLRLKIGSTPLYLQDLYFRYANPPKSPLAIALRAVFTVLPRFFSHSIVEIDGNGSLDTGGHYYLGGSCSILGYKCATGSMNLWTNSHMHSQLAIVLAGGTIRAIGTLLLRWNPQPFYWTGSFWGSLGFDVPKWLRWITRKSRITVATGGISVGSNGFSASTKICGITLRIHIPPFWQSSPPITTVMGETSSLITRASPPGGNVYLVPENCPSVVFACEGKLAPPSIVLTRPDGSKIDPSKDLPEEGPDFIYRQDTPTNTTGFMIGSPVAGKWKVSVKNPGEAGETTIHFVPGNSSPNIIPREIEKLGANTYKLIASAYDADDDAEVTFYWCMDNAGFAGTPIGTTIEHDGRLEYSWSPSEDQPYKSGYIYAEIKDSSGETRSVFFSEKLSIGGTKLRSPRFSKCKVVKDKVNFKARMRDGSEVDYMKVYYSDDLKKDVPTAFFSIGTDKDISLDETLLKPGRKYQMRMTSVAFDGSESPFSKRRVVDYKASKINNHPYFAGAPECEACCGSEWVYCLKANDYDGDELSFKLITAPEGMTLDPGRCALVWTPGEDDFGNNQIVVEVSDGKGGDDRQEFTLMVSTPSTPVHNAAIDVIDTAGGRLLLLRVFDRAVGKDRTVIDKLRVNVTDASGDVEFAMVLRETGADSNLYQGCLQLSDAGNLPPAWLTAETLGEHSTESQVEWKDRSGHARRSKVQYRF